MNFQEIKELKDRIMAGGRITREEALRLSHTSKIDSLYYSANQLRAKFCGHRYVLCASIKAVVGTCPEDCGWCPLSAQSTVSYTQILDVSPQKIINQARELSGKGIKNLEISINRNTINETELTKLINLINEIESQSEMQICASLGSLSLNQLKRLKNETRISKYHCNIESSKDFFEKNCSSIDYNNKLETLRNARKAGFDICSGGIIGMGESMEDRIDMAITLRDLDVRSISLNIHFAFSGTPMEQVPLINSQEILTTFALFRFINPKAQILFAKGRSQIRIIEKDALQAGINASLVGELLLDIQPSEIDSDIRLFEEEGFRQ